MAWLGKSNKLTWEPGSNLPPELVDEFEKGITPNEVTVSDKKFGVVQHTLVLERHTGTRDEPPAKRTKLCQNWDEG